MSKMGQFVMEAQEVACQYYNISKEDLVKKLDQDYPNKDSYFKRTVLEEWEVIQEDLYAYAP